jgi:AraC family transcriptional regulator, arabinose operon regulatory protein
LGLRARIDTALLEADLYAHSAVARASDLALNALERALLWLDAANPGSQPLDDRVREAVLFIAANLGRPLDVRTIANAVHLSPSRLAHLFTEQPGIPPGRFLELRRMQRAKSLLESSSLPIGAVAGISGFKSQYYFASRFKALAGVSPSAWRRRARPEEAE